MADILPPKSDEVFKMLFGDEQDTEILIAFLKAVLPLPGDDYDEITIMNPFLPGEVLGDKIGILDLRVKTKTGKQIDVEIQVANHIAFKARILYYLTRLFTSQIAEGEDYSALKSTIGVVITDFVCIADSADYHNVYCFCDCRRARYLSPFCAIFVIIQFKKIPQNVSPLCGIGSLQ
ncbi:MAG: Rpn family recombination-promoting nuclease/putative transposase [Azoarcus sp.]|jgi:predicted transposase/invertase (TIGR01784 family)|nr:Rpn family recombination-promoting nuclease/putative transposase [Azoarcus sp.]